VTFLSFPRALCNTEITFFWAPISPPLPKKMCFPVNFSPSPPSLIVIVFPIFLPYTWKKTFQCPRFLFLLFFLNIAFPGWSPFQSNSLVMWSVPFKTLLFPPFFCEPFSPPSLRAIGSSSPFQSCLRTPQGKSGSALPRWKAFF